MQVNFTQVNYYKAFTGKAKHDEPGCNLDDILKKETMTFSIMKKSMQFFLQKHIRSREQMDLSCGTQHLL